MQCNNQKFLTGTLYRRRRSNITAIIIVAGSPQDTRKCSIGDYKASQMGGGGRQEGQWRISLVIIITSHAITTKFTHLPFRLSEMACHTLEALYASILTWFPGLCNAQQISALKRQFRMGNLNLTLEHHVQVNIS